MATQPITKTEPLPLTEEHASLIADLYDIDANFDKMYGHYVKHSEAAVALLDHTMVTAYCGFTWVPTRRADGLPLCPKCKAIYDVTGIQ